MEEETKKEQPSETTSITPEKAKKMLREDKDRSEAQKGFLGAIAGKEDDK